MRRRGCCCCSSMKRGKGKKVLRSEQEPGSFSLILPGALFYALITLNSLLRSLSSPPSCNYVDVHSGPA